MDKNIHIDNGASVIEASIKNQKTLDNSAELTPTQIENLRYLHELVKKYPNAFMRITAGDESETTKMLCSFESVDGYDDLVVADESGVFLFFQDPTDPEEKVSPVDIATLPGAYQAQMKLALENDGYYRPTDHDKDAFRISIRKVEPGKDSEIVLNKLLKDIQKSRQISD